MTSISAEKLNRPGTISIIVMCFLASGAIRLAEVGTAVAQEMGGSHEFLGARDTTPQACEPEAEPSVLLAALQTRESQLAERESYIDRRQQVLEVAETRIKEQMQALEDAQAQLSATLTLADDAAENDISHLTEMYERMKPAEAAGIFETMDIGFAAGFFARMRPESSAAIMAQLPADLAYSVSVIMAGRNANAPRE